MVNKVQEKRTIQLEATRKWIEEHGNQRYMRKTQIRTVIILTCGLALSTVISIVSKNATLFWIPAALTFVYMAYWMIKGSQEGRKFWNEIKDKEHPIKLQE